MEELLPVWYLNSPKAAVSILDGTYDSVMLLFFPSVFPLSSFLLFLSKEKTQDPEECADVLSSLTLLPRLNLTDPTHTHTHRCWYLSLCLYFDALLLFPRRPVQTAGWEYGNVSCGTVHSFSDPLLHKGKISSVLGSFSFFTAIHQWKASISIWPPVTFRGV